MLSRMSPTPCLVQAIGMLCYVLYIYGDGCDLALTFCKYDLFVLRWAGLRQVRGGISSDLLIMGGGGMRSILLLPPVARC